MVVLSLKADCILLYLIIQQKFSSTIANCEVDPILLQEFSGHKMIYTQVIHMFVASVFELLSTVYSYSVRQEVCTLPEH